VSILKLEKVRKKTTFTNERRALLTLLLGDEVSKSKVKYHLCALELAMQSAMNCMGELAAIYQARGDKKGVRSSCAELQELEDNYTKAVNGASQFLAEMSQYGSRSASEVTGLRYSREPDKIRRYLESIRPTALADLEGALPVVAAPTRASSHIRAESTAVPGSSPVMDESTTLSTGIGNLAEMDLSVLSLPDFSLLNDQPGVQPDPVTSSSPRRTDSPQSAPPAQVPDPDPSLPPPAQIQFLTQQHSTAPPVSRPSPNPPAAHIAPPPPAVSRPSTTPPAAHIVPPPPVSGLSAPAHVVPPPPVSRLATTPSALHVATPQAVSEFGIAQVAGAVSPVNSSYAPDPQLAQTPLPLQYGTQPAPPPHVAAFTQHSPSY